MPKGTQDLRGSKMGHLTVASYAGSSSEGSMWACTCACGKTVTRSRWRLMHAGPNSSCGCINGGSTLWVTKLPPKKDLTGKQYGWLTVIGPTKRQNGTDWLCKCRCGKTVTKRTDLLLRDNVHPELNCGCHKHGQKADGFLGVARRGIIARLKGSAATRHLVYSLPDELVMELGAQPCHYCGDTSSNTFKMNTRLWRGHEFKHNGLDRLDGSVGYLPGNVVSCCKVCNTGKLALSKEAYIAHCHKVARLNPI